MKHGVSAIRIMLGEDILKLYSLIKRMKAILGILLVIIISLDALSQSTSIETDSIHSKKFYNRFSRDLKKEVQGQFAKLTIGDSIWIPLDLSNAGGSYGVISNYSNYPELPSHNVIDTSYYSTDCMVFGIVEDKRKNNGLYTVQVIVMDVCGLDSLGGGVTRLVKPTEPFDHNLISFWFFTN